MNVNNKNELLLNYLIKRVSFFMFFKKIIQIVSIFFHMSVLFYSHLNTNYNEIKKQKRPKNRKIKNIEKCAK